MWYIYYSIKLYRNIHYIYIKVPSLKICSNIFVSSSLIELMRHCKPYEKIHHCLIFELYKYFLQKKKWQIFLQSFILLLVTSYIIHISFLHITSVVNISLTHRTKSMFLENNFDFFSFNWYNYFIKTLYIWYIFLTYKYIYFTLEDANSRILPSISSDFRFDKGTQRSAPYSAKLTIYKTIGKL